MSILVKRNMDPSVAWSFLQPKHIQGYRQGLDIFFLPHQLDVIGRSYDCYGICMCVKEGWRGQDLAMTG